MRMYKFGSLSKGDWDKMENITNNKDKNSVANGNPPSATLINLKSDLPSNKLTKTNKLYTMRLIYPGS